MVVEPGWQQNELRGVNVSLPRSVKETPSCRTRRAHQRRGGTWRARLAGPSVSPSAHILYISSSNMKDKRREELC